MKPILKRIIASIMALCIVGLTCVATSAAQDNQDVVVTILMDKPNYSASDTANVTVRVSNNSTNQLRDVVICVETDNWLLAKGSNSNIADIGSLDSGASREMSFSAVLNRNARGISFFSRIILFFKQIFSRPSSFSKMEYNNKDSVKSSANVSHGGASVKVTAACYYDTNMPDRFSEGELKDMADVDKQIHNLIGTNAFQNDLNAVEQQNQVETLFDDLENKNLIEENSVNWDSESSTYTFTYSNGVLGAVMLAELSNEYNGPTTSNDVIEYDEVVLNSAPTNALSSNSIGDALILYAFNFPSDMQSFRNPFYNTTENDWENKGLDTTRDTYVTVNDLKNIDSKYEIIVFAGHGTTYNGTPSLCLTETVTKDNYQKYASDLKERRIAAVSYSGDKNGYYLAFPSLISSAYGASGLNSKFVYSESCCFMGEEESAKERYNYDFSNAFLNAGAQAVVGCHNSVDAVYSRDFMKLWVDSLIAEKTAKQSFDACVSRYGKDDSQSAYRSSHPGTPIAVPVFSGNENSKLAIQKEKYTVTFNANGGSVSPASSTVESGRSVTLPTPTRSYMITYNANSGTGAPSNQNLNASCKGWSTSSSATSSSYNCGSSYTPMSSITLYAVWGNATGNVTTAKPTRSGYSFAGWSTTSSANTVNYNPGSSISINKNTTLYAVWSKNPNTYTITYNANGGINPPASQTKTEDIDLILSTIIPTRTGYNFLGWSTSSSATSAMYAAGDTYTANSSVTLYAVWKIKTYTISYNPNAGSDSVSNMPSAQTKTHDKNLTISSNVPVRSGYNFWGYSTDRYATRGTYYPDNSAYNTYSNNESVTLYAIWEKQEVILSSYSGSISTSKTQVTVTNDNYGDSCEYFDGSYTGYKVPLPNVTVVRAVGIKDSWVCQSTPWQIVSGDAVLMNSNGVVYLVVKKSCTVKLRYWHQGVCSDIYTYNITLT